MERQKRRLLNCTVHDTSFCCLVIGIYETTARYSVLSNRSGSVGMVQGRKPFPRGKPPLL